MAYTNRQDWEATILYHVRKADQSTRSIVARTCLGKHGARWHPETRRDATVHKVEGQVGTRREEGYGLGRRPGQVVLGWMRRGREGGVHRKASSIPVRENKSRLLPVEKAVYTGFSSVAANDGERTRMKVLDDARSICEIKECEAVVAPHLHPDPGKAL